MSRCVSHRGPDGSDLFFDEMDGHSVSFGHSRLSIVDIEGSDQPISSDHSSTLIHNGEIYNFRKIRKKLASYPWRTSGDSESIIALHSSFRGVAKVAPDFPSGKIISGIRRSSKERDPGNPAEAHVEWVSKLEGMWAFALWDQSRKELILCRDSVGIKPLIRTILGDGTLLFASEIKAFHGHPDFIPVPDIDALAVRLAYEYPLDRTTLFKGVSQVSQGTIETWGVDSEGRAVLTGVARFSRKDPLIDDSLDLSGHSKILLDTLRTSVKERMTSESSLGIVLSGGLDSSLIATLAKEQRIENSEDPPTCWTVAGNEDNPDMIKSQVVTSSLDLPHQTMIMPEKSFWNDLPRFVWNGEDSDISVLFWQPLFENMSKKVKVGLCGQGADELHGGYDRYRDLRVHSKKIRKRLDLYGGLNYDLLPSGLGNPWHDKNVEPEGNFENLSTTLNFEIGRGQLSNFQLRLADRHGMATGIEARVPFLSSIHLQASKSLPDRFKISGNLEKIALREAASRTRLPPEIVSRPKLAAGTSTAPDQFQSILDELKPHAMEWSEDYGSLSPMLKDQPEMAIGIRILHSVHFTDGGRNRSGLDLMTAIDDVGEWIDGQ